MTVSTLLVGLNELSLTQFSKVVSARGIDRVIVVASGTDFNDCCTLNSYGDLNCVNDFNQATYQNYVCPTGESLTTDTNAVFNHGVLHGQEECCVEPVTCTTYVDGNGDGVCYDNGEIMTSQVDTDITGMGLLDARSTCCASEAVCYHNWVTQNADGVACGCDGDIEPRSGMRAGMRARSSSSQHVAARPRGKGRRLARR